jgi:hypothetical protein
MQAQEKRDKSLQRYGLYAEIAQDIYDQDPQKYRKETVESLCNQLAKCLLEAGIIEVIENNNCFSVDEETGNPMLTTAIGVKINVVVPERKVDAT